MIRSRPLSLFFFATSPPPYPPLSKLVRLSLKLCIILFWVLVGRGGSLWYQVGTWTLINWPVEYLLVFTSYLGALVVEFVSWSTSRLSWLIKMFQPCLWMWSAIESWSLKASCSNTLREGWSKLIIQLFKCMNPLISSYLQLDIAPHYFRVLPPNSLPLWDLWYLASYSVSYPLALGFTIFNNPLGSLPIDRLWHLR